jgi:hypothetical protein
MELNLSKMDNIMRFVVCFMNLHCKSKIWIKVCICLEGDVSSAIVLLLIVVINYIHSDLMMLLFL